MASAMRKRAYKAGYTVLLSLAILISMACVAGADLPVPPPPGPLPHPSTSPGTGGGSSPGGSPYNTGYTAYATPTPTPVPEQVPSNELCVYIPDTIRVSGSEVHLGGNTISVPGGTLFANVFKNDTLELPLDTNDGSTAALTLVVDSSGGGSSASIKSARLVAEKNLTLNGAWTDVSITAMLNGLPAGGKLIAELLGPGSADIAGANGQLALYGDAKLDGDPLAIVDVRAPGMEDAGNVTSASITFKMPRPDGFDPAATYDVLRQSDGMQELLKATLASGPGADPLVFEAGSPHGFSTFALVKVVAAGSPADRGRVAASARASPATASPAGNITVMVIVFVAGIIVGILPTILFCRRYVASLRK